MLGEASKINDSAGRRAPLRLKPISIKVLKERESHSFIWSAAVPTDWCRQSHPSRSRKSEKDKKHTTQHNTRESRRIRFLSLLYTRFRLLLLLDRSQHVPETNSWARLGSFLFLHTERKRWALPQETQPKCRLLLLIYRCGRETKCYSYKVNVKDTSKQLDGMNKKYNQCRSEKRLRKVYVLPSRVAALLKVYKGLQF